MDNITLTHVGGPTLLLEIDGVHILPTFDSPRDYVLPGRTLPSAPVRLSLLEIFCR